MIFKIIIIGGEKICHAGQILTILHHLGDIRYKIDREFGKTIEAKTCHLIAH